MTVPDARVLRCPACGGTVAEDARLCGYCRAPVATVRCIACYHTNIPDAVHCSGCGHTLGLEPAGEPDLLKCPDCAIDLEVFRAGPGKLRDCARCGGQFVEHALMNGLIERQEVYGTVAPRRGRKPNPLSAPLRYVPCPECRTLMNRKNFGGSSGIVVDVCVRHGLWFDRGELPLVLGFIESGGLAAARHREIERLERLRREAPSAGRLPAISMEDSALSRRLRPEVAADAASHALSLLELVADLWPG